MTVNLLHTDQTRNFNFMLFIILGILLSQVFHDEISLSIFSQNGPNICKYVFHIIIFKVKYFSCFFLSGINDFSVSQQIIIANNDISVLVCPSGIAKTKIRRRYK